MQEHRRQGSGNTDKPSPGLTPNTLANYLAGVFLSKALENQIIMREFKQKTFYILKLLMLFSLIAAVIYFMPAVAGDLPPESVALSG